MPLARLHFVQIADSAGADLEQTLGGEGGDPRVSCGLSALADQNVIELLSERREFSFRIQNDDLNLAEELLGQAAQKPGLSFPAVRLDQHSGAQERIQVESDVVAVTLAQNDFAHFV
jgi:hypothetical protein